MAYMLGDLGFFLLAARPEGGAGNGEALGHNAGEIHLGNRCLLKGYTKDFAIRRAGVDIALEVASADAIQNNVYPAPSGLAQYVYKVLFPVVNTRTAPSWVQIRHLLSEPAVA